MWDQSLAPTIGTETKGKIPYGDGQLQACLKIIEDQNMNFFKNELD